MKLTELERRRAYKRAYELLGRMNELLDSALIAHIAYEKKLFTAG